jgi:hypothetical protein
MQLFGTKEMLLTFEKTETYAYFLSKTDVLLSEKHWARPSFFERWYFSHKRESASPPSLGTGNFAVKWCLCHFKSLRDRQYSFYNLTQFSLVSIVLDPLASNICGCLTRETGLVPFTWMQVLTQYWCSSHTETLIGGQYYFPRGLNSHRETGWKTLLSLTHCTVPWATGILRFAWSFFHSLEWGYFAKAMILTHENTER